jgi:hypothetical protein
MLHLRHVCLRWRTERIVDHRRTSWKGLTDGRSVWSGSLNRGGRRLPYGGDLPALESHSQAKVRSFRPVQIRAGEGDISSRVNFRLLASSASMRHSEAAPRGDAQVL